MVKSEPKKKPQPGGFFQKFFRKPERNEKEQRLTVQRSIPYLEMGRDGICRVEEHLYSKTVRFYDINYQLAQNEDKNTIFESWCDFLNYFDASIRFQLSFINHKSDMSEYNKVIQIEPQHDAFDDVRMEYAQMLKQQLAKGNNGLVRTKYITFSIEAKSVREAKPRLERIETDILNNFKVLGVKAYPLNGVERLQIMYETFHQEEQQKFDFSYDRILQSGMTTKDFIAPTSFLFKSGKDFMMGDTYGAASYLNILAPELTDKVLAEFLDMQDIEKRNVNCIIVKDLSRFGRNYIETGRYLERIFPFMGVRFIAINDHYDSAEENDDKGRILIPFNNLINDTYCRDISLRVRSHLDVKRKKGQFIGSFAGYGYRKDPKDKNHLIIDEYAAGIVQEIFKQKLNGMSSQRIASHLNELGVLPPNEYKRANGFNYTCGFQAGLNQKWTVVSVNRILKNESYTGTLIQGKRRKINYKVKKSHDVGSENWIRVEDAHDAMLDELYSNAYIYTLPSDLEGMPLSLLEAMSYGNCCLVSDIPECAEVVEDKALIFKKSDVEDLREKLQEACDHPEMVMKMKKQAADFICEKYNWDEVVKETMKLYRRK